ncbi:MAG: DegQ family serine endoprotease [Chlorobiaceae bacterium]|nr:DegQ family serine endoprotease [Chlorobiaceae bacterium]
MKKKRTTLKSFVLVSAGLAAGALAISDVEFSLDRHDNGYSIAAGMKEAVAAENIQHRPIQSLNDFNEAFVHIAESATPSVVTIYTESSIDRPVMTPFDLFGKSLNEMFNGQSRESGKSRKEVLHGLGSGVIVSSDGYILTNNHVIDNAYTISIRTSDNRRFPAKIVGKDPRTDIAVIKIDATGLKPIPIGNSDRLRVGEWVIAIGSPLGENLARTVTQGIVSAKGRANVGLADYEDFIQTDAAINPGNSGGALVNINGELVGISTAMASRAAGFEGIGFAVPSNMANRIFSSLVKSGRVERGYLGISIQDVDENIARGLNMKNVEGVLVGTVMAGGPGAKAGLKTGDVVLDFDGRPATSSAELRNDIANHAPGSSAAVRINRDGKLQTLTVRLEALPDKEVASVQGEEVSSDLLGFMVAPLDEQTSQKMNMRPNSHRLVVTSVKGNSPAFKIGLRPGDVILSIDKKQVGTTAAFNELVKNKKRGDLLFILVERGWSRMYFAFNL